MPDAFIKALRQFTCPSMLSVSLLIVIRVSLSSTTRSEALVSSVMFKTDLLIGFFPSSLVSGWQQPRCQSRSYSRLTVNLQAYNVPLIPCRKQTRSCNPYRARLRYPDKPIYWSYQIHEQACSLLPHKCDWQGNDTTCQAC